MKTILVPTDFSKNSINAIDYAVKLAKKEKAKIILLHAFHVTIISPDVPAQFISEEMEATKQTAKKKLKAICSEILQSKVECKDLNVEGLAVDVILNTIIKKKPYLVIMGTKGASGIKEILIGSNTASIIEKATCPVVAVPEGALFAGIKNITYATDYLESDITALKNLVEIAKPFNAQINALHASDEEFSRYSEATSLNMFKRKVQDKIKYKKISFNLVNGKYLSKILEEHIKKDAPDLLAMSTHHRSLIDKIFGTSITKKIAYHTKVPLIAFHHQQGTPIFL